MNIENDILPQGPLSKKQYNFLDRFDRVVFWVSVLLSAIILFAIPFGTLEYGTYYADELNVYIAIAVVAGLATLTAGCAFFFIATERFKGDDPVDKHPLPFMRFIKSLGIVWAMLIIWAAIHLLDNHFFVNILFYAPAALFLGLLFGATAWALVAAPVAMLVRVIHQASRKKDASLLVPLALAIGIIVMASLIVIGPIAVHSEAPGKIGAIQSVYALLGIPGDYYTITNDLAFLIGRCAIYTSIVALATGATLRRYFRNKMKHDGKLNSGDE